MKTKPFTLVVMLSALSVYANQYEFPAPSAHRVDLVSTPQLEGVAGIMNWPGYPVEPVPAPFDHGHMIDRTVVSNATQFTYPQDYIRAYYYLCGAEHTPPFGAIAHTAAGHGSVLVGMPATQAYLNSHPEIALSNIKYKYGANGADQTKTWNLHGDVKGINWFADPTNTVEERLYQADPADVTAGLYYNDKALITFSYSDFYAIFDYGASTAHNDDTIKAFSDPVLPIKPAALPNLENGLADAMLTDIAANGGAIRLTFDTIQSATREDSYQPPWLYGLFAFQGAMQVVTPTRPMITRQPTSQTVPAGTPVTLSVQAIGQGELHYQWLFNGQELSGRTEPTLTLATAPSGPYQVVISNQSGSVTSEVATVTFQTQMTYNLKMYAGIEINGSIGAAYQVSSKDDVEGAWTPLSVITLTTPTQIYFDTNSPSFPKRFYKVTPVAP